MTRMILIILCLMISQIAEPSTYAYQQPAPKAADRQSVKLQAQEMADAVANGNHERAADLTYPKLVTLIGGRAAYIALLKKMSAEMNTDQAQLSSVTMGEPDNILLINRKHFAVVPTTIRIKVPDGTLVGTAYTIGISTDGGKNWTFIGSGGQTMNKEQLRTLIGAAVDQLQIPEVKRPVLYPG